MIEFELFNIEEQLKNKTCYCCKRKAKLFLINDYTTNNDIVHNQWIPVCRWHQFRLRITIFFTNKIRRKGVKFLEEFSFHQYKVILLRRFEQKLLYNLISSYETEHELGSKDKEYIAIIREKIAKS